MLANSKSQTENNKQKVESVIWAGLSLIILMIASRLILRGSGLEEHPSLFNIFLLSLFIIIVSSSKKIFIFIVFPFFLIYALYAPIGMNFGYPRYQHLVSLIATDFSEGAEFLGLIPLKYYLYAFLIPVLLILFKWIQLRKNINFLHNKVFMFLSGVLIFWNLIPFSFFHKTYSEIKLVRNELAKLEEFSNKNDWGTSILDNSKYDDYVLIIGESARADYHNAYGYPINNTPFMSTTNGVLVKGLLAAGGYTIGSLKLMLTKPTTSNNWKDNKENYNLNLIDLVNSAGLKTYWFSNQGFLGEWDTPITSIANKSNTKFFLNSKDSFQGGTSDFDLLPIFKQTINDKTKNKRFIVLHIYGSHPNTCDRVKDYKLIIPNEKVNDKYKSVNCYVSSIAKTDDFIEKVVKILRDNQKDNNRTFSLVYFSDHGLIHKEMEGKIVMNNNPGPKGIGYLTIPLLKIASDDSDRKVVSAFKSGLNFTNGIANWIGIKNTKLDSSIDLFSDKDDLSDYGQRRNLSNIKEMPPIDIRINQ